MSLSAIVDVTISAVTVAPTRVGFGTPMVLAQHTIFAERAREYADLAAMIADGFAADDPATLAVTALLAQNPAPSTVVVGRAENDDKMKIKLTPLQAIGLTDYVVYVNGKEAKHTSVGSPTVATIVAGLKVAIDALSEQVVTTDNTTDLDVEATTIPDAFQLYVADRTLIGQENTTPDAGGSSGVADDIAKIQIEHDDWYSIHLCNNSKAVILAAAAYIETVVKLLVVESADDAIYDSGSTTDVAAALQTAGYARTALMYHKKANVQYAGAAWAGKNLPKDPGSVTWKFKTLAGVDYMDFTAIEITNIEAKDCNYYSRVAGVNITQQGKTSAGEFIDITRGTDFMRARLQEFIFAQLAAADKIPYTDRGVAIIEAEVRAVMLLSVGNGILAAVPEPTVTVPLVADVPIATRAARTLPDVKFEGTLAGAIHKVVVTGTVSV